MLPGLFTLTGASVYISYSQQALEEIQKVVPPEDMAYVDVSFGWSLAMAWLSYVLEVATGLLLGVTARVAQLKRHRDSHRNCLDKESEREKARESRRVNSSNRGSEWRSLDLSIPVQNKPNQTSSPDATRPGLAPMQWID